ncbi:MAG TPA: M28 family peptidase [Bryobacteraceae bacterium]|nr:M28 family peptidase [Bryobacteraceae bacterium]
MRRILFGGFVLFAVALAAQNKPKMTKVKTAAPAVPAYGNSDSITEYEMKIYDYFLASDQLEGRNLPSRGYDTAALYVASHLAEWGLKPGGSTAGTNGPLQPYLMPFELVSKSVIAGESKATVTGAGGGGGGRGRGGNEPRTVSFDYGKDWTVVAGGRGAPPLEELEVSGGLAFVGNGYVIKKTNIDPFQGVAVKGKIVVVAGLPAELAAQAAQGGRGGGRGAPNPLGEPCTDFMTPQQAAAKNGALAVVTFQTFDQLAGTLFLGGGGRGGGLNGPQYTVPAFNVPGACPSVPAISAGLAMSNRMFLGEKKSASDIFYGAGTNAKLDSFELAKEKTLSLKIAVKSESNHAENVVGILEGGDPVKKNEFVVFSAHLDHIGLSAPMENGHNVNNGADDDGSGSTALLAMARAYSEGAAKGMRPARSIIFLWNAGEEKGLWGSQYFNEFPFIDLSKVVANLNIDMIGRTKTPDLKDNDKTHVLVEQGEILLVGPNISSDELEKTIEMVNDGYQKLKLNHFYDVTKPDKDHDNLGPEPNGQRIFYRSDHYNFAKVGIPIVFFTTGLHPDYHRPTDTPDKIDYKEMMIVTKTVSAVGWVLANQDGRPALNKSLPEQLMKDMKSAKDQGWGKITPVMKPLPGEPF